MSVSGAVQRGAWAFGGRALARWIAICIGIVGGFILGLAAMNSFFVATSLREVIGAILGMAPLLPLTVLGIFRPRPAAYGMFASALVFILCEDLPPLPAGVSFAGAVVVLGIFVLPPCLVAGLLLYASRAVGTGGTRTGRAEAEHVGASAMAPRSLGQVMSSVLAGRDDPHRLAQARWAAIVLGVLLGAYGAPWGWHWVVVSARQGDWWSAVGIGATALTLLPLSILAVLKPRAAAYGVLASLAVVLAYDVFLSMAPPFTANETATRVIFSCFEAFPFALIATLLLYASTGRSQKT